MTISLRRERPAQARNKSRLCGRGELAGFHLGEFGFEGAVKKTSVNNPTMKETKHNKRKKKINSLNSPIPLPITTTARPGFQQPDEKPSPMHQQQLLHRQLDLTPEPRVLPPTARMHRIRTMDS